MSYFDDDEERDILLKSIIQEDIVMKGNINPQQGAKLLRKQQQHYKQKEKLIYLKFNARPQISPKQELRLNGQEHQRWPKNELEFQFNRQQRSKYKT